MMLVVMALWYLTLPLTKALNGRLGKRKSYIPPITSLRLGALNIGAPPRSCTPAVSPGNAGKHRLFLPAIDPFAANAVVPTRPLAGSGEQGAAFPSRVIGSLVAKLPFQRDS